MDVYNKQAFNENKEIIFTEIKNGAIFIYPTDTIYGIGCDATNQAAVQKIRELKQRPDTPLSILAPSKQWILDNLAVTQEAEAWLAKIPGPYTLILEKKKDCVAPNVTSKESLGVRMINHWFQDIVADLDLPIITTSVNIHGEQPLTSLHELHNNFKNNVAFFVDDGVLDGKASTIVDLTDGERIIKR